MPELLEAIQASKLKPEIIITHELPLEKALEAYKVFDDKAENCRKVVLKP